MSKSVSLAIGGAIIGVILVAGGIYINSIVEENPMPEQVLVEPELIEEPELESPESAEPESSGRDLSVEFSESMSFKTP